MLPLTKPPVLLLKGTQISDPGESVQPLNVAPIVTPLNVIPGNNSKPEKKLPSAQAKPGAIESKPAMMTDANNFMLTTFSLFSITSFYIGDYGPTAESRDVKLGTGLAPPLVST